MGGIYWDVLGETGVYSQQCQYQKTYSLAAFVFSCFFIVFWHVFKTEQGTVRVRFLHSSLHIDWQGKKRVTRLNSLHASLGA